MGTKSSACRTRHSADCASSRGAEARMRKKNGRTTTVRKHAPDEPTYSEKQKGRDQNPGTGTRFLPQTRVKTWCLSPGFSRLLRQHALQPHYDFHGVERLEHIIVGPEIETV